VDPHLNAPTYGRTADNYQGGYYSLSGTSGASPHTAGTVALIWSAHPDHIGQIDQTFTLLEQSANHSVPAGSCGKPACAGANAYPNYEYGWGYLDALAAVEMAGSLPSPPSVGTFEPYGGSGTVGQWQTFTTTYTDPDGYGDIDRAFFFLDRQPPIASGGLAAAYIQSVDLLVLLGGGSCQPGQPDTILSTPYVSLDCENSSVSGAGDTLTINWHVRPDACFVGGCNWNYAAELVTDNSGLNDVGVVGWWRLDGPMGQTRIARPGIRPTDADVSAELDEVLGQLMEQTEAW